MGRPAIVLTCALLAPGLLAAAGPAAAPGSAAAPGPAAAAGAPAAAPRPRVVTLLAAGDVEGCGPDGKPAGQSKATARLLARNPGTIAALGDLVQGESGTWRDYRDCYGPAWGKFRDRTRPALGNHDYRPGGARGFFAYFRGRAGPPPRGYYSYQLGTWHIVVLNSNCDRVGGCGRGSAQERWLRADLAAHRARCTLAYWHHPLFTSAAPGVGAADVRPLWEDLYRSHADLILNGHRHQYERFAPQTPGGRRDQAHGIREFVVGTGGAHLDRFRAIKPNSQVRNDTTFGVLRLRLGRGWYRWRFLPVRGHTFTDSGSARCS
jgi:hypothetical protein